MADQATPNPFRRAQRKAMPAKAALVGPAGAGKTLQSLMAAMQLSAGKPVALIDTEHLSSTLYADEWEFDVVDLGPLTDAWHPQDYIDRLISHMRAAEQNGYGALVIDSFSHAWDAILRIVDLNAKGGNSWSGWAVGTPQQQRVLDTMLGLDCHTLVTMRARTEWVLQETVRNGRTYTEPTKVGMGARQREGVDYEFQLIGNIDLTTHQMSVEKSRARLFADRIVAPDRVDQFWREYRDWLATGVDLASDRQLRELRELLASTKELDAADQAGKPGRRVRDGFRDWLDGRLLDQLMKAEATEGLYVLGDLLHGGDGRVPAPVEPDELEAPFESDSASPAVEHGTQHEGASGGELGEDDEPDDEVSGGTAAAGPRELPEPDDEIAPPQAHDVFDVDHVTPRGRMYLWPPTMAGVRFGVLLAVNYGVDPGELTDEVLIHAVATSYDPSWILEGATEGELSDASYACSSAVIDATADCPDPSAARELIDEWRARVPGPQLEPEPAAETRPAADEQLVDDTHKPAPRRRRKATT